MYKSDTIPASNRLGFHYFPDTLHYTDRYLQAWLPQLLALGAGWVTLLADANRAIPEYFLSGLLQSGIQPVLHVAVSTEPPLTIEDLRALFRSYVRWGVKYVSVFDRPNSHRVWSSPTWAQTNLVERFLDIYLPLAEIAFQEGLSPIFPPLEPGGDFWDLVFLRLALRGIARRALPGLQESLILGAYAWGNNRALDWGAGGPERWRGTRPYFTPQDQQDHLGFYIFDWYLSIAEQELGRKPEVILLRAGCRLGDQSDPNLPPISKQEHARRNLALAGLLSERGEISTDYGCIPSQVLSANFWLLAADPDSPHADQSWFGMDGNHLPVVNEMLLWANLKRKYPSSFTPFDVSQDAKPQGSIHVDGVLGVGKSLPISHYVLLPLYAWGSAEWDLRLVEPLLQKYHPAIGFSLDEARLARRVTVVGGDWAFSDQALAALRAAGCEVERLLADGTLFAT